MKRLRLAIAAALAVLLTTLLVFCTNQPGARTASDPGEIANISFRPADKAQWEQRFTVSNVDNVEIEWVTNFGNGDKFSLKGTHKSSSQDYTGASNAIRLTFETPLSQFAVYTISYSVYAPRQGNEGKSTLTGLGIVLSEDYPGATGVVKFPITPGTINIGEWVEVNTTTPLTGLNEPLRSIDFRFVVNEAPYHADVWYIDNIRISQRLLETGNVEPDYRDYPALKDVYKDYFLIGTTSGNNRMTGDKLDIIQYHFNAFTPENEMKPDQLQNSKGVFTYNNLDQQLAKVSGLTIIGHTLAWHSQTPAWMWGNPPLSRAEAKANLDAHIENVMRRYGAGLYAIDVVNEAFNDGEAATADWRGRLRSDAGWYLALGPEWIELAFLKAAEIADQNGWDVKLYYNDYNLDYSTKATAVYNMVRDINERYAGRRPNGKLLIQGIGMQGHYNQNTSSSNIERSINLFSSLPGVSISITELDITWNSGGQWTEALEQAQAYRYAEFFRLFRKNAAGPANNGNGRIERVTFWGTNDADSWRSASFPLLFDRYLRGKEALKAVLDPDGYGR
ncbi:MAG: endo-1,4-beta-xylanase [Treponema sp.]|nr:endo-1,4-beta-xylanase [Treponema sp.]